MPTHPLTADQVEIYRTEGFVVVPRLFDATALRSVESAIDALTQRALRGGEDLEKVLELEPQPVDGKRVPRRIYNPLHAHESFRALATDARLLDRVECLVGPDIDIQHSKLNMKPPHVGSEVDWHQDLSYFPHTNDDVVTVLVYLDDADQANGCLQVLPRHHHHFFNHFLPDGEFAGMITEQIEDGRYGKPVPLAAPAGSAIFMHAITPHSSLPNRSSRGRRTLIFEYRASDSFPIYAGDMTVKAEELAMHVRGKVHKYARFKGPQPPIPLSQMKVRSLYERQEQAKAVLAKQA